MNEIKNLFSEKLTPAIRAEVDAVTSIRAKREQIEATRQGFLKKIEATHGSIAVLETAMDDKIIAGKPVDEVVNKLALRKGELTAYERQIQRLQGEDTEAALIERAAQKGLSEAIGNQLEALRPDIQVRVEELMKDVIKFLCSFEAEALDTARNHGVDLPNSTVTTCFRFLDLRSMDHIAAFCSPIGADLSIIRRREAREQYLAPEKVIEPEIELVPVEGHNEETPVPD